MSDPSGMRKPGNGWFYGLPLLLFALGLAIAAPWADDSFGQRRFVAGGMEIDVFTYRPPGCDKPSALVVFHGLNRKAERLRDKAVDVASAACLMVFAPRFDEDRFPNWRYHRAGVVRGGEVQPERQWTGHVVRDLLALVLGEVGNPDAGLYLFGHSAGGQFLSRLMAYTPLADADRIVIANPSVYAEPRLDLEAPYGFQGVWESEVAEERLRAYLGAPITIYLGQEDTGDRYLVKTAAAMALGENRLERGRAVFRMAQAEARERGWRFGWTLVEAPGVGHSSGGMLGASALLRALGLAT